MSAWNSVLRLACGGVLLCVGCGGCVGCSSASSEPTPGEPHVTGPEVGTVRFHLTNTTAQPLYAVENDRRPRQLSIDGLTDAVAPYIADQCGGDGTHDDPTYTLTAVAPGTSIDYVWGARTAGAAEVRLDEAKDCATISHVSPQSYSTHACLLLQAPPSLSMDLAKLPQRCVDAVAVVPATGETQTVIAF